MASQLQRFKTWLLERRFFRVARFAKDPKNKPEPEAALAELPKAIADQLMAAANELPVPPCEESFILEGLGRAISQWKKHPEASANSIVILADPVSSISRVLTSSLIKIQKQLGEESLPVNLLDWIERPVDALTIKQQIKTRLGLDKEDPSETHGEDSPSDTKPSDTKPSDTDPSDGAHTATDDSQKALMIVPNLCWCFLRSVNGLEGLDYMQELLPQNHANFWVLGSGIVGWEYLKSTLKFHAYCGDTLEPPPLSGEDLQQWLSPLVDQFDIYFVDTTIHKRLQDIDNLLSVDIAGKKPIAALSEIGQELTATVQASAIAIKNEVLPDSDEKDSEEKHSPQKQYFARLAEVSDGVDTVALQLFIKSLRYREIEIEQTEKEDGANNHKEHTEKEDSANNHKEHRVIATTPKLSALQDLSQSDLYLLYSLLLHGDLTIASLAESLGDAPNVVTNQVQLLRKSGIIEQQGSTLKANPAYYPQIRRELDKNNFVIETP